MNTLLNFEGQTVWSVRIGLPKRPDSKVITSQDIRKDKLDDRLTD